MCDTRDGNRPGDVVGKTYLPQGYVKANGATVQRADYPRLVNLANRYNLWTATPATYPALFGQGDGSATMVLPDWRGVVMRFVDDGKGYDAGRVLGTYQEDAIRDITGWLESLHGGGGAFTVNSAPIYQYGNSGYNYTQYRADFSADRVVPTAAENRGKNIAVLAVMRY